MLKSVAVSSFFFFFQAEDGIRDRTVTGVQTCALPISRVIEIAKTTDGPPGVGTVYASTVKDAGVKTHREFKLTEFEVPTRIRWTELSKNLVVVTEGGYDLAPAGEGTQLTYFNELQGRGIGVLIAGFALRSARKGAEAFAQAIKTTVESA